MMPCGLPKLVSSLCTALAFVWLLAGMHLSVAIAAGRLV
jgi:hypothetical protein